MVQRFSTAARRWVLAATDEARRRGDRRVGTGHLLVGLLHDPAVVSALGVDVPRARAALDALDRRALAAVGVSVSDLPSSPPRSGRGRIPFTAGAKLVLGWSVRDAKWDNSPRLEVGHLLLALLDRSAPDPAVDLLAELGVDPAMVRRRLHEAA
jgi:ATP-dependent Clp protease ATP-binding subunit ClpA